jgi:hypothetical protein
MSPLDNIKFLMCCFKLTKEWNNVTCEGTVASYVRQHLPKRNPSNKYRMYCMGCDRVRINYNTALQLDAASLVSNTAVFRTGYGQFSLQYSWTRPMYQRHGSIQFDRPARLHKFSYIMFYFVPETDTHAIHV